MNKGWISLYPSLNILFFDQFILLCHSPFFLSTKLHSNNCFENGNREEEEIIAQEEFLSANAENVWK
jgi:hypothetical protein